MAGKFNNFSGARVAPLPEHIDEFKCHPNYMNDLREVYMTILAELADSRVGEEIIQQVRKDPTFKLFKFSDDLGNEIMQSEYFLS